MLLDEYDHMSKVMSNVLFVFFKGTSYKDHYIIENN